MVVYKKPLNEEELYELAGFTDMVKDWIAEGGEKDFDAFYAKVSETEPDLKNNNSYRKAFEATYDRVANGAGKSKNSSQSDIIGLNSVEAPSDALAKLAADTIHLDNSSPAATVMEKYAKMTRKLDRVLLNKSDKRYFILMGDPGIGKTYTVTKECERLNLNLPTYTGDVGSNPTAVMAFLWVHRDDGTFILDDCDTMVRDNAPPAVSNSLKGAMGAPAHMVTMSTTINQRVNKLVQGMEESVEKMQKKVGSLVEELNSVLNATSKLEEGAEDSLSELREAASNDTDKMKVVLENAFWLKKLSDPELYESKLSKLMSYNGIYATSEILEEVESVFAKDETLDESTNTKVLDSQIEKLNEASLKEDDVNLEDDEDDFDELNAREDLDNEGDGVIDTDEAVPTTFEFKSRMIIISNCVPSNINPALLSRADYFTMQLTADEYLVRLAAIIDGIKTESVVDPEVVKKAKGLILSTLPLLIEAAKKGVKIGGKVPKFTHPLEFRMVNSLIDDFDGRIEELTGNGVDLESAITQAYQPWVCFDFIPVL